MYTIIQKPLTQQQRVTRQANGASNTSNNNTNNSSTRGEEQRGDLGVHGFNTRQMTTIFDFVSSPTLMRRPTDIGLRRRSLRELKIARRISTWRPAGSAGNISSPWLILWTVWLGRSRGLLRSGLHLSSPVSGTVPTARWRASSRLVCPFLLYDQSPCLCVAVGPRLEAQGSR